LSKITWQTNYQATIGSTPIYCLYVGRIFEQIVNTKQIEQLDQFEGGVGGQTPVPSEELLLHPEGVELGTLSLSDPKSKGKPSPCACTGLAPDTCCKLVELTSSMKMTSCIIFVALSISLV
jgi:hypothetical protein